MGFTFLPYSCIINTVLYYCPNCVSELAQTVKVGEQVKNSENWVETIIQNNDTVNVAANENNMIITLISCCYNYDMQLLGC